MISALVAGQAAIDLEDMTDDAVLQRVMQRLRKYHPGCNVPDPVRSVVTRWGQDPWTRGSYSSVPPGSAGAADYHEVAANVDGRLFFAGEATSAHYPAQMHGAYDSGLREVRRLTLLPGSKHVGIADAGTTAGVDGRWARRLPRYMPRCSSGRLEWQCKGPGWTGWSAWGCWRCCSVQ